MDEVKQYLKAKKNLADVSKGGKDYITCSPMDIIVRMERLDDTKQKAIIALGEEALKRIEDELEKHSSTYLY